MINCTNIPCLFHAISYQESNSSIKKASWQLKKQRSICFLTLKEGENKINKETFCLEK